jgi:hypothetical protein
MCFCIHGWDQGEMHLKYFQYSFSMSEKVLLKIIGPVFWARYRVIILTGTKRNQCSSSVFSRMSVYFLKQVSLALKFLALTIIGF